MTRAPIRNVFLSASVPLPSRNAVYFFTADVIAIRDSVRALVMVIMEQGSRLVFGGHPAITPMIRLQILQSGRPVGKTVIMYQSRFFERSFHEDNQFFERVIMVDGVDGNRDASLEIMRKSMLDQRFQAGIFIGGMEGVEEEYAMFREMHPRTPAYPIASTGAAANKLYEENRELARTHANLSNEVSYLTLMRNLTTPIKRRSGL
jgi:hypothetical protein